MSDLQQERINNGKCPSCGEEAAPYYLCSKCRHLQSMGRLLNRGERVDVFSSEKRGRAKYWSLGKSRDNRPITEIMGSRPLPLWGEGKARKDRRLRPRLGGVPIEVERELLAILLRLGQPATEDELIRAWGKLRVRYGRASAAGDLAQLIKAERRRERRNKKRLNLPVFTVSA